MKRFKMPMNLQFFAEGEADGGTEGAAGGAGEDKGNSSQTGAPQIDYEKLASIVQGKQKVAEETVLKNYLKQQGLSGDELNQAIATFKAEKAKNTPDVTAIQTQAAQAQKEAETAKIELEATKQAVALGIDTKSLPYVLKMTDMSNVKDEDGKINAENVKAALEKVLEDVPALKTEKQSNNGFKVGAGAAENSGQQQAKTAVSQKRWNRFNN